MSEDTQTTNQPPQTAMTIRELVAVIQAFLAKGAITADTPIALYNDAECNRLRWCMAFSSAEVPYSPDEFPFSLDEPDDRVPLKSSSPITVLTLMPAD